MAEQPYYQGFEAAEFAKGRNTNPYEYHSQDWWQWEYGYCDYLSARAEQYEDDIEWDHECEEEDE